MKMHHKTVTCSLKLSALYSKLHYANNPILSPIEGAIWVQTPYILH